MKIRTEIKVGIVVLAGLAILIYGYNFLKGRDVFKQERQYYAIYDHVEGLTEGNPVQINGYTIGRVNQVRLHPDNPDLVVVGFIISEKELDIPKNSLARIQSLGILGSMSITLEMGNSTVNAQRNDTLASAVEEDIKTAVDKRLQPLEQKTKSLISSIDTMVQTVQAILDKEARENLTGSFEGINRSIQTFETTALRLDSMVAEEKRAVNALLNSARSITNNIEQSNDEVTNTLKNFSAISDSLASADLATTVNNAKNALRDLSETIEKINKGEGTLGMLINNDTLYQHLEQSALEMDKLLEDIRVNPGRYMHFSVFGRKEKLKDKPEKKER